MADATRMGPGPTGRKAELAYQTADCALYDVQDYRGFSLGVCVKELDARLLVYGSPYGGLSDEQAGRAWCKANGKSPKHIPGSSIGRQWGWHPDDMGDPEAHRLPRAIYDAITGLSTFYAWRHTEADAYAAVGWALRELAAVLTGRQL